MYSLSSKDENLNSDKLIGEKTQTTATNPKNLMGAQTVARQRSSSSAKYVVAFIGLAMFGRLLKFSEPGRGSSSRLSVYSSKQVQAWQKFDFSYQFSSKNRFFVGDFFEIKQFAECFLPFRVTTQLEINKLKSDEIAGVMTNQIQVKELKVNENVPVSLFELAPSPGDTVVDNDAVTIGTYSPTNSVDSLENSLAEAKSILARSKRLQWLSSTQWWWGVFAFMVGILCYVVLGTLTKKTKTTLLLVLLATAIGGRVYSQESELDSKIATNFSNYVKSDSHPILFVEMNGDLNAEYRPFHRYLTPLPFVNILSNEEVARELEILDYQLDDLKKVAERLHKAIEDSEAILDKAAFITDEHKEEVHRLLDEPSRAGFKVVDKILVPHQVEHLKKIFMSYQIRRVGLCAALTNEPLVTVLEISPAQKAKLELVLKESIEAALGKLEGLKKKALEDILAKLTRKQRQQLKNLFGDDPFLEKTPFSVFLRQFDPAFLKKSIELEADNPWPEYFPLVFICQFRIGFDSKPQFDDSLVANRDATIDIPDQLLEMLQHPKVRERFNLVDYQQQQLQECSALKRQFFQQKHEALNAHAQKHGWTNLDEYQEVWSGKRRDLATEIKRRIDATLLPFQLEQLRQFSTVVGAQRIGVVYSLSSASLGKDIEITEAQKDAVAKAASRLFAQLTQDAENIEKKVNDKLLAILSPEQQRKLKTVTSEFIDLETGQLDLHHLLQQPALMRDVIMEQRRMLQFLDMPKEEKK